MYELTPHQTNALNTNKSISLTANAGSGKTFVLASRLLKVILETNTSIHEIAAITFTEKAAGELNSRIADELTKLSRQSYSPDIQKKIEKVRKQLVSASISTIHSFCINLLKEFPVEASLDANFIPVDQRTSDDLIELSTEKTIRSKLSNAHASTEVKILIRLLGSKKALAREIELLVRNRKNLSHFRKIYTEKSLKEIAEISSNNFIKGLKKILSIELPEMLKHLTKINEAVLLNNSKNETAVNIRKLTEKAEEIGYKEIVLRYLATISDETLTKSGTIKSRGYLTSNLRVDLINSINFVERNFKELNALFSVEKREDIEEELACYSRSMLNITVEVINEYENKKTQLGYLDFEDILLKTKEILSRKDVRKAINKKYKYLFVDEYQDTNEIQYEIFLPIVNYLKTGNLFIVGDEKQSIYRFRDAELEVFGKTKTDIKNANNENLVLTLPDSFRMAPAICLFTNHIFSKLFNYPISIYNEVEHSDIVCARNDSFMGKVEFLIAQADHNLAEAELIAQRILKLSNEFINELPDWSSIAVLVQKRSAFSELEKLFIKYNIPFSVIGGTGFYQQQSISDIYNYFAFIFNNSDDAALIGTLRSPFFTVPDVKIFQLSTFTGDSYWEKLSKAGISDDYWKPILLVLIENLKLAKRIGIPSLLQKILNESDFISTIAARNNGEQEINNINKLISITIKFFNLEFNSIYDYLNFMKNSIINFVEEAQAGIEDNNNGVNVMTIHQAKGLQFPSVFLYKCDDTIQSGDVKARSFKIDKTFGLLTKIPKNENYFGEYYSAPIVELYNYFENKKSIAELKRLLYVGITRAKNFLFISMKENSNPARPLNSFSSLIYEGLNIDHGSKNFSIKGDLNFLEKANSTYKTVSRNLEIEIPIIRQAEQPSLLPISYKQVKHGLKISTDKISDKSKEDIISATKFSIFTNCPRKYNLTYNFNLNSMIQDYVGWLKLSKIRNDYEFNLYEQRKISSEETFTKTLTNPDLKGRIIHKILQKNIAANEVELEVNRFFKNKNATNSKLKNIDDQIKKEIISSIRKFILSNEYKHINSFKNYKNELEVYYKLSDYYLMGIIDKAIFTQDKIIVVDYKTDNIIDSEISERAEKYIPQLNFYSFILKRLYPRFQIIETKIIFIKYPDMPFVKNFTKNIEIETEKRLGEMINSIRNNIYSVNLEHCSECIFTIKNNDCVLDSEHKYVASGIQSKNDGKKN
ncbi:MAG: UvrD-helicase domain-containing protein [Ignavibacteria bacterium]|nr:UvrD-helicase domain-containing protein [Ignavibacteria bacterium]